MRKAMIAASITMDMTRIPDPPRNDTWGSFLFFLGRPAGRGRFDMPSSIAYTPGQAISLPPKMWACMWCTVWPAFSPVLKMTR